MKFCFKPFLFLLCCTGILVSCNTKKENKVLIIGVDGSRPDAILKANTPNIDSLWKNGSSHHLGFKNTTV